jgi:hypothetical protein
MNELKLTLLIIYVPTMACLLLATWKVCNLRKRLEQERKRAEQLEFHLRQKDLS